MSIVYFLDDDLQIIKTQNYFSATLVAVKDGKICGNMKWTYWRGRDHDLFLHVYLENDSLYVASDSDCFIKLPDSDSTQIFVLLREMEKTFEGQIKSFHICENAQKQGNYFSFYGGPFAEDWKDNIVGARRDSLWCEYHGRNNYNYNYSNIKFEFIPPTGLWEKYWTIELLGKKNYKNTVYRLLNPEQSIIQWIKYYRLTDLNEYSKRYQKYSTSQEEGDH